MISAGTTLTVSAPGTIALGGQISAPFGFVDNGTGTVNVLAGTQIQTGGQTRPTGAVQASQLPSRTISKQGFFISTGLFNQLGALSVVGSPSVLRVDSSGPIQFGNAGGIAAPNTWLILSLSTGAKATGAIVVANLDVVFTGSTGGVALIGSVANLTGNAAAGAANIQPSSNATFQVNGCPIASVNCVLLTTQGIPTNNPLGDVRIGSIATASDDEDLLLPLVSDEVY